MSMDLDDDYIREKTLLEEDVKFEIINNAMNEKEAEPKNQTSTN